MINVSKIKEKAFTDVLTFEDGTSFTLVFIPLEKEDKIVNWEVDLISQPSYSGLSEDLKITHRKMSDRQGVEYQINLGKPDKVATKEDAKRRAQMWCELTWLYINNGRPF